MIESTKKASWPVLMLLSLGLAMACGEPGSQTGHEDEAGEETELTEVTGRVTLSGEALESLRLEYAKAREQELSPHLEVPAEIVAAPDRRATIGPRVAGRVLEVGVNVGDEVEPGDLLVVLESQEVGRAWADLIAARARENVARRALERQERLLEGRVTSRRAVEEAEGALQVAEADLQAAQTRLATFGISASAPAPSRPARVPLTSPIAGKVVERSIHVGQWVEPSETVVDVIDLDELWVRASVYEREMRFVSVGQLAQVDVRAFPGEVFKGTVAQMSGTLDERARTAGVRIVLPNPGHRLRPGMFATVRIHGTDAHEPRRLLAIPSSAVQQVDGRPAVFVRLEEGTFELRPIHTGQRAGDLVEILNGLRPGDEVVAEGSFLLKGQLLRSTLGEDE